MSTMSVLNNKGDFKHKWDANDNDSWTNAATMFNELTRKGYLAFKTRTHAGPDDCQHCKGSGKAAPDPYARGEQIRLFDKNACEIIFVPPMAGG